MQLHAMTHIPLKLSQMVRYSLTSEPFFIISCRLQKTFKMHYLVCFLFCCFYSSDLWNTYVSIL